MRQVPQTAFTEGAAPSTPLLQRHLVVGRGKLARHWHHYLSQIQSQRDDFQVDLWEDARTLKDPFFASLNQATHLWLLISDSALSVVFERIKAGMKIRRLELPKLFALHASGALHVPGMLSVHPLMTFGPELYAPETYARVPLVSFSEEAPIEDLARALEFLPNPKFRIRSENRALYHALCAMSANFAQILWSWTTAEAQARVGLPLSAFAPILEQSTRNFLAHGREALTGPLVRGDQGTIDRHLEALRASPALRELYPSFIRAFQALPRKEPV